ncbi:hypothetical protein [Arthrobacter sp. efr-133-R2A-63]|uniref:hypothetical protein n=1 Tax=Arthrobacter sp. efr-133-R2A-63 TaxID=3040278 RepID=UPI00254A4411|nr:hypothetical protein [Arthrobacter sp. efr-133-R2A-63]
MTQATAAKQPKLHIESGVKMLRFDGVDDILKMATAPVEANVLTVAMIARAYTNPTTQTGIIGLGGATAKYNADAIPKNVYVFWTGTGTNKRLQLNASLDGANFHTLSVVGDRVGGKYAMNVDTATASVLDAGTAPFQGNGQIEVGAYAGSTYGAIDVLEVITWNTALTQAQHFAVRDAMRLAYPGIVA